MEMMLQKLGDSYGGWCEERSSDKLEFKEHSDKEQQQLWLKNLPPFSAQ
jgi:hypothetical protein